MSVRGRQEDPHAEGTVRVHVQLAATSKTVSFHLRGAVLVYYPDETQETTAIYTPVEQVEVLSPGRRGSSEQYAAGLIPSGVLGIIALAFTIDGLSSQKPLSVGSLIALWGLFAFAIAFAVLLIRRGRPTGRLRLGALPQIVEFWYTPGVDKLLDHFLQRLAETRAAVCVPATIGVIRYTNFSTAFGIRELLVSMVLLAIPALIFTANIKTPLPFLILVVPFIFHLHWRWKQHRAIKEMRMAQAHRKRGEYDRAAECLQTLLAKQPRHLPAWNLLINLYLDCAQYEEAAECCNAMQAIGVIDGPVADDIRRYVAMRHQLDERLKGAGLGTTPGEFGDLPLPFSSEINEQTPDTQEAGNGG